MHPILIKVTNWLHRSLTQPMNVEDRLIEEFGDKCKQVLRKHFQEEQERKRFTLRMSNIGKPVCQLQMEKMGAPKEPMPYSLKMKFIYGDLVEALGMFILKASGVNIQAEQVAVDLDIGGTTLSGTLDVEIDDAVYDLKSTSGYAFKHKFGPSGGYNKIAEDKAFGYVHQGFAYGAAYEKPFAGWIAINKESGEWNVVELPDGAANSSEQILGEVDHAIRQINNKADFRRCYEDILEKFNKRPTGNRMLGTTCGFCEYKRSCWPNLEFRPALASEADNPTWKYYTHIDEQWKKKEIE